MVPHAADRLASAGPALFRASPLLAGCGGDSSGPSPTPMGKTIYAVDLSNNFALEPAPGPGDRPGCR